MKKALHISIAQTLFTIEEDAYATLERYLADIRAHFSGSDEIAGDIENRIAEKLGESKRTIITNTEVDAVIASIGRVEDFDSEKTGSERSVTQPDKKLFRNPDDKIIAGVCAGLANYFGIDALWVRVAFVVFALMNGFGILLYVILAITIPEAKTASQKLEMTGSPVTLATLGGNFKEQVEDIKKRHGRTIKELLSFPFLVLKKIIAFARRTIMPFLRVLISIALMVTSGGMIFALTFAIPFVLGMPSYLFTHLPIIALLPIALVYAAVICISVLLIIPALFVFLFSLSMLKKKHVVTPVLGFCLLGVWFVSLIASATVLSRIALTYP